MKYGTPDEFTKVNRPVWAACRDERALIALVRTNDDDDDVEATAGEEAVAVDAQLTLTQLTSAQPCLLPRDTPLRTCDVSENSRTGYHTEKTVWSSRLVEQ